MMSTSLGHYSNIKYTVLGSPRLDRALFGTHAKEIHFEPSAYVPQLDG
jgi:hypothetical protein